MSVFVCVNCLVQCLLILETLISNTKFISSHTKMLIKEAFKISCEKKLPHSKTHKFQSGKV